MQYKTISPRTPATTTGDARPAPQGHASSCRRWRLYARELKTSHEAWKETLSQARPGSDPSQIASEALEMALKELEDRLPSASPPDENGSTFPRRGNGVHPPSHVARAKGVTAASRRCLTPFQPTRPPPSRNHRHPRKYRRQHEPPGPVTEPSSDNRYLTRQIIRLATPVHRQRRESQSPRHPRRHPHPARPSSRSSGPPRRRKNKRSPASPASGRSPCRFSPIRSPAATRMPAGRPSARS